MEKELDADVIKSTQLSLGKYVKRPPLSEKLLKKPPFRFLHDVITSVLKTTGFFADLFDAEELTSDNVKDRDSKLNFLTKVIFVLSTTTGKSISAKPSKIVAGQEPEKTNELLQCLAQALDEKLSSDAAVKKYKDSLNTSNVVENKNKESNKTVKKPNDSKKTIPKITEKLKSNKNEVVKPANKQYKDKINEIKSRKKEAVSNKTDSTSKKPSHTKTITKTNNKEPMKEGKTNNKNIILSSNSVDKGKASNLLNKSNSEDLDLPLQEDPMGTKIIVNDEVLGIESYSHENLNASYTLLPNDLNSSASTNEFIENENKATEDTKSIENNEIQNKFTLEKHTEVERNENVHKKNLPEPIHESPKAETISVKKDFITKTEKDNLSFTDIPRAPLPPSSSGSDTSSIIRPTSVRPSSSRPGAPRMREKIDNVVKDSDNLLLGKVNIIVESEQPEEEEDANLIVIDQHEGSEVSPSDQQGLNVSSNEHGHLVQQILDSQKELSQMTGKTEIEWQFGAQKAREAVNQEVEQLRFNIQALSRVTNPLRKLLDHIQEDVEVMRQELQQWTNIYDDVSKEMLKQKTLNEDSLQPFHTKLKQLESDIEEKHDKIDDLKVLIHKNASKIEKLLTNGNVQ